MPHCLQGCVTPTTSPRTTNFSLGIQRCPLCTDGHCSCTASSESLVWSGSCILLSLHSPFPDCTSASPHLTMDPLQEHHSQTHHKCLKLESFGVSPLSGLILPYSSSQISKWSSPPSDHSSNRPPTYLSTASMLVEPRYGRSQAIDQIYDAACAHLLRMARHTMTRQLSASTITTISTAKQPIRHRNAQSCCFPP